MELTPVEEYDGIWLKRDDLFDHNGCFGGKVRSCIILATKAKNKGIKGLTTAVARDSPQGKIVATVAKSLGLECRCHIPKVKNLDERIIAAQKLGAVLVAHQPCYNTALRAWSIEDAQKLGWFDIPFGMESREAINCTADQVQNIPRSVKRVVISIGSGISAAGLLSGLKRFRLNIPILGVSVGANREKILDKWAPFGWRNTTKLVHSGLDYHDKIKASVGPIEMDEVYEAKAVSYLEKGDLFWIVGRR